MEWPEQFARPSRIVFDQLFRFEAGMGNIASSSATHFDLGQQVLRLFEDRYFEIRIECSRIDSGKKAGRTATYDHEGVHRSEDSTEENEKLRMTNHKMGMSRLVVLKRN
jgi:hypothetical protein